MNTKSNNNMKQSEFNTNRKPSWFLFYCAVAIPVFWVAGAGRDLHLIETFRQGLGGLGLIFLLFFFYGSFHIRKGGPKGLQWQRFWANLLLGSPLHEDPNPIRGDGKPKSKQESEAIPNPNKVTIIPRMR